MGKISSLIKLIAAIILCEAAGAIGSLFTAPKVATWYMTLNKPAFTPPGSVIGLVWTVLYFLMGVSLYLLIVEGERGAKVAPALSIFALQLALNVLWSFLFFGLESPFIGFLGIVVLWIAVALTIHQSWQISRRAAYFLIPYILWVSFAGFLNFIIWILNP